MRHFYHLSSFDPRIPKASPHHQNLDCRLTREALNEPILIPSPKILGLLRTPSYDTFQLGLMVWWMATGTALFDPEPTPLSALTGAPNGSPSTSSFAATSSNRVFDLNEMHLARMMTVLGRIPREVGGLGEWVVVGSVSVWQLVFYAVLYSPTNDCSDD